MRVILWIFAVIGFLATALTVLLVVAVVHFSSRVQAMHLGTEPTTVADNTVLSLDLERPITESSPRGLDVFVNDQTTAFPALLAAIRRATRDDRVKGLVARTGDVQLGLAQARSSATRSRSSAPRASSPSPSPIPSARSPAARAPIMSRAPSTRSGCSRRAIWR